MSETTSTTRHTRKSPYATLAQVNNKPFIKWAGGKTQLLPELMYRIPQSYNRYFEPFIGGGALYFAISPNESIVADINEDLVNTYIVVRDHPHELIAALSQYKNEKEFFYEVRSQAQGNLSHIERAARLIYLNRTCFNGLYRVNKSGGFNVPFGSYKNPNIVQIDKILASSTALQNTDIKHAEFSTALSAATAGDFIYLDPPYFPKSVYSDFKRYNKEQFHVKDHERLARLYNDLNERGCKVMLSNSDTPFTRSLYDAWRVETVSAKRMINRDASKRGEVTEIIVTNYGY